MAGEPIAGRGARFSGKGSLPGMAQPYGAGMYSDGRGGFQSMWDMGANGAQTAPSHGSGRSMWDQGPSHSTSGERPRSMWDQGPPAAQTVAPPASAQATASAASMPANSKRGTVKSYSVVKGFGFILCPEIPQDIYFGRDSLQADLRTSDVAGTEVLFELIRAPDGKPQARSLKPIGPIPKPSGVQLPAGSAPAAASQAAPAAAPVSQAPPVAHQPQPQQVPSGPVGAGVYGQGMAMMAGSGYYPGKGAPTMMPRPGYPMGPPMGHPTMGGPMGMAPHPGMWPGKGGPMPGQTFPMAGRPGMFPQPVGRPGMPGMAGMGMPGAMGAPSLANPPPGGLVLGPMGRPMMPHRPFLPMANNPDRRRDWSPHAGSKAIRAAMLGEREKAAAAAGGGGEEAKAREGSRSVSSRSSSRSSSKSSPSRSRSRKKKKKKKRGRSDSSTISSSSSSRKSKKSKKDGASGSKKDSKDKDDGKAADSPEIQKAKMEVLEHLKKLQSVEPKELRTKEFRALLRNWHPDKNPENVEVATAIFQFLQKGKALLNLR